MRKIRSIALVTAIAVGGLAVAATNPLDIGSATGAVTPTAPAPGDGSQAARPAGKALDQALSGLVAKGTITESQAAAVKSAIRDEAKKVAAAHPRRRVVRGARRLVVHASAKAIGIPDADLVKALRGGVLDRRRGQRQGRAGHQGHRRHRHRRPGPARHRGQGGQAERRAGGQGRAAPAAARRAGRQPHPQVEGVTRSLVPVPGRHDAPSAKGGASSRPGGERPIGSRTRLRLAYAGPVPRLRVAACQINTRVGDLDGNADRMLAAFEHAEAAGCDIAVFPELAVTGYPPEDLLLKPGFIADNRRALERIAAAHRAVRGRRRLRRRRP